MFQAEICKQLRKLLKPDEFTLRSMTDDSVEQNKRLLATLKQIHPSAVVAISIQPDPETIMAYRKAEIPMVLIDEEAEGVSSITSDNFMGGHLAGEHLILKSRKNLAVVSGRTQVKGGYNAVQRVKGFREALRLKKVTLPQDHLFEVPHYSREDGTQLMPELLQKNFDAIFCAAGDNCAIGLMTVAKDQGVRIPDDVAIIGYDDLLAARVSNPPMTTISQPLEKMAKTAYEMAVLKKDEIFFKPKKVTFNPELIIRQSA